ncbi:MAG: 50S ribosomal protein L2 [bacterium]|nr:50S ribosomal protein L2 [bacterium]
MGIRVHKPTTAGRRKSSVQTFDDITSKKPEKNLVSKPVRRKGRGNDGVIRVRHRGGGARRFIREIDFKRDKFDIPATVKTIEYDPNRGARIALLTYADGEKRYILAPQTLKVGMTIVSSEKKGEPHIGNRFKLEHIPPGMTVYNIELQAGKGAQMARGAGNGAVLMAVEGDMATLKLPSGEIRLVKKNCMATIGAVSNPDWRLIRWGKAGRTRHRGIRPTVRGKAMNPVDHPHGGGEGSNPIGLKAPKTPTGKKALGVKTRRNKITDRFIVKRRNKK